MATASISLGRSSGFRVTGAKQVSIFETHLVDPLSPVNSSDATTATVSTAVVLTAENQDAWLQVLRASQDSSLKFLREEEGLYDDGDGEPV